MDINTRVKLARKNIQEKFNLTKNDFYKRISYSEGYWGLIESHRRPVPERIIKLLCMEFNINENWLVSGNGEMFNNLIDEQQFINLFNSLNNEYRTCAILQLEALVQLQKKEGECH